MLITDHDLLLLDSSLFVDAGDVAGRVLFSAANAAVSGTTLTSAGADFESLGVGAGSVAIVDGEAIEVDSRTSPTELEISLPRPSGTTEKIPPGDGTNLALQIITFIDAIARAEASLLSQLGLAEDDPEQPLDVSAIVNAERVGEVLALQVMAEAYATAAAGAPSDASLAARADLFAQRSRIAAQSLSVLIDLDGDGEPDSTRRLKLVQLDRT